MKAVVTEHDVVFTIYPNDYLGNGYVYGGSETLILKHVLTEEEKQQMAKALMESDPAFSVSHAVPAGLIKTEKNSK